MVILVAIKFLINLQKSLERCHKLDQRKLEVKQKKMGLTEKEKYKNVYKYYIYIYMYVCMHVNVYVCIYIYICIYICIYI